MNVSVIMASYNGAKYILPQIESILTGMDESDELIISDDGSTDGTIDVIKRVMEKEKRIIFFDGPHKGVIKNFEFALRKSTKDIIMFCDQDDVWFPQKLSRIKEFFEKNKSIHLVLHDMYYADNKEIECNSYSKTSFKAHIRRHGVFFNWIFSAYFGCCMAITKEMKEYLLPFSKYVNMHDQWVGLIGEFYHCSAFIPEPLIIHREHGKNASYKRPFLIRIKYRFVSLVAFLDKILTKKWG